MLNTLLNKRFLFASLLVVLLAFTLAACDADTGDDATLDEPGVVTEPMDDEGLIGDDDEFVGDDADVIEDDDLTGDDDVLTDTEDIVGDDDVVTDTEEAFGNGDVLTDTQDTFADDRIGMDEPAIEYDENDAFEATGRVEAIDEDEGFFDLGFDDEPSEQVYLREGDAFDNYDFAEGDVVNVRGARENDELYADEVELGDATLFDDDDAMLDDADDTGETDVMGDNGDMADVPEELTDDSLGLATTGIVWWDDQFELTGNIDSISDDYITVTYPEDGEEVTQDIYLFSAPVGASTWADFDLSDDDVVSLAGFVGQTGRYYATEAVLDVGLFEEDRPAADRDDSLMEDDMDDDDDDMDGDDDDNGLFGDDSDELGIQWDGDEFSLTGYIVGQPDLINNELTIQANGEEYDILVADTTVYDDDLLAADLMDGDLVEIEGVRDATGTLWAHDIELEDDDGLLDS